MIRGLFLFAIAILVTSCVVRHLVGGPRLTGTCNGACDHYIECKPGGNDVDKTRCQTECPGVFSDRVSLMAFESMSCKNTIEYIEGSQSKSATSSKP